MNWVLVNDELLHCAAWELSMSMETERHLDSPLPPWGHSSGLVG